MGTSAPFPPHIFSGRRYAVLGLGRNGEAAARRLAAMGADVVAWDDQKSSREAFDVRGAQRVVIAPVQDISQYDALVLSPGIPHNLPQPHEVARLARESGVPVVSDAELLYQAVQLCGDQTRFVGITGTNGKSTTTVLLSYLLRESGFKVAAGGNLGPAALALPRLGDGGIYVLEMSSYMLERLQTLSFDVACLLNFSPDHLERHGDMQGYIAAKQHIFDRQTQNGLAVVGIDDDITAPIAAALKAQRQGRCLAVSGRSSKADVFVKGALLQDSGGILADMRTAAALPGEHNAQNAAAAVAAALFLGTPRERIGGILSRFTGLAHRQRLVQCIQGVEFIDDSKATNADAAARALSCYESVVWIAGGIAKAGGIEGLAPLFPRVRKVFLIGQDAALLARTLQEHRVEHDIVETLDRAVPQAFDFACKHHIDTVLLSPACASFDQFANFEARGLHFAALVSKLR